MVADAATCSGSAGFICLFNSCQNDIAAPATCKNGAWACPSGTVACSGGCTGNPPPGWVCVGGVWARPDAGSDAVDAGTLTYVDHIQPILRGTCGSCHATNSPSPGSSIPFVDSYAVTQRASMSPTYYGCPGESVGACINRAAEIQQLEGSNCRTFDRPFHRDGFDRCITDAERALIAAWVAGGMIER